MFKLTEQDLRVAKPLANIFMASIVPVSYTHLRAHET